MGCVVLLGEGTVVSDVNDREMISGVLAELLQTLCCEAEGEELAEVPVGKGLSSEFDLLFSRECFLAYIRAKGGCKL